MLIERKKDIVREIKRDESRLSYEVKEMSRNFTRCGETKTIPIKNIAPNPHQPRKEFDKGALQDLAISIMEYGLMQPITVRQTGPFDYELIAGERRLTACKNLGMAYIPAIVMTVSVTDSAVLALVENIQRENLNFIEEAEAFSALIQEHGLTQEQLADKLGKSQSAIANKLRILRLPQKIRDIITENGLTERHARALLRLPDDRMKLKAVNIIVERGFNVTRSEELIEKLLKTPIKEKPEIRTDSRVFRDVRIFANTIRQAVELMRKSGIDAKTNKTEKDDIIEYTITIPKQQA